MALKLQIRDDEIKARNNVAEAYTRLLSDHFEAPIQKKENGKPKTEHPREARKNRKPRTPHVVGHNVSAWAQYTIQVDNRGQLQRALKEAGIPTAIHYPTPLNQQPAVAHQEAELPIGDAVAKRVISLPMHPYLDEAATQQIAAQISASI